MVLRIKTKTQQIVLVLLRETERAVSTASMRIAYSKFYHVKPSCASHTTSISYYPMRVCLARDKKGAYCSTLLACMGNQIEDFNKQEGLVKIF